MQPLVSILIPTYNGEQSIAQTLRSAVNQDHARKEIIVVDDGSTDRTFEIASAFASKAVKVVRQSNAGAPAARNTAIRHAQGDYIHWLDHDDLLAPSKVGLQAEEAQRLGDRQTLLSGPFSTFYYRLESARHFHSRLCRDLTPSDYFFFKFSDDTFLQTSAWLVSRELTDRAGPWWELKSPDDDGEYFCRVAAACNRIHYVPEARSYWRVGNSRSFSGAWKRSRIHLDAMFQTTLRCLAHYEKLEDTDRSRAARLAFIQRRLFYFHPEAPAIVDELQAMAARLGGRLEAPSLPLKYRPIRAALGWPATKRLMYVLPDLKHAAEQSWDRLMDRLQRPA